MPARCVNNVCVREGGREVENGPRTPSRCVRVSTCVCVRARLGVIRACALAFACMGALARVRVCVRVRVRVRVCGVRVREWVRCVR
jgi:hypothetical protein